jgi:hypothetical protein
MGYFGFKSIAELIVVKTVPPPFRSCDNCSGCGIWLGGGDIIFVGVVDGVGVVNSGGVRFGGSEVWCFGRGERGN